MKRLVGVDVARGVAVLGMFTAHVGPADKSWAGPYGWLHAADGRSAATFALLAGLSAALLSGAQSPLEGSLLRRSRVRVLARAGVLLPLGFVLAALGTPVAVILPGYALMFGLLTLVLRAPPRALLAMAAVVVVVGPPVVQVARAVLGGDGASAGLTATLLVGPHYPALVWIAYLLVGLAVGRQDLTSGRTVARLAAWGAAAAAVGYGTAAVAGRLGAADGTSAALLLTAEPHSDTGPEVVGSTGVALVLLALCLAASRAVPLLVVPLASTGALALTAYCVHVVAIAVIGDEAVREPTPERLLAFVVVTVVLATAWRTTLGRGPLERLLHAASTRVADAVVPLPQLEGRASARP